MNGHAFQFLSSSRMRGAPAVSNPARPDTGPRLRRGPLIAALFCLAATVGLLLLRLHATAWVDHPLILVLNRLARRSPALDHAALVLQEFNLPKGGLIFALAAAAFAVCPTVTSRVQLIAGCVAAALAAVLSRATQILLPHSPRPMFDPALTLTPPIGADQHAMRDWSSFPSDNAALLFGVTLAVWFADRWIGALAFLVFLLAALARVYGGLHYPTDMLGGAALSAMCVMAARSVDLGFVETQGALIHRYRALWAGLAFLFAFLAASLFDDLRAIALLIRQWS
jgi:undecaprenyl-diphosphatase